MTIPRWLSLAVALLSVCASAQGNAPAFFDPPTAAARLRLTAHPVSAPLTLDGALDEPLYARAPSAHTFTQVEPKQGAPATHETKVWVGWDDTALYVGARLAQPGGTAALNQRDLRRDFDFQDADSFSVVLDTYGDGRNAFGFQVNPYGALRDVQVIDDALTERNWDAVWSAATARGESGWTVELAIPWKSIRHGGPGVTWGVQFFRRERGVNEDTAWSPFPRTVSPFRMPYAGAIEGMKPPPPQVLSLQLRPYAIARAEREGGGPVAVAPSVGGEATWNPTENSVVDLTVNTDFAETDVDRRVVNLSRFSVFFPERRQFFLESSGLFTTGNTGLVIPFFSRSIGLVDGKRVPISAGVRAVYRSVERSAGALFVHTLPDGDTPAAMVGVARYSHNLGEQSRAGAMVVARHDFEAGGGSTNLVPVLDGLWREGPVTVSGALMGSTTAGPSGQPALGTAGTVEASLQGNWGRMSLGALGISPGFEARSGFVGRGDIAGLGGGGSLDYRPDWLPSQLRSVGPFIDWYALWGASDGRFQEASAYFSPLWFLFAGGDELWLFADVSQQVLTEAFEPVPKVAFAPGAYGNERLGLQGFTQASRRVSLGAEASLGQYYGAEELRGRLWASLQPIPHVQLSASWGYNRFWGQGVTGAFADTHLILVDSRLALSPKLQLIGSFQRDTAGNANVLNARLAWEFQPLSFLYVVFTDTRAAYPAPGAPPVEQRVVAKLTYTFRL